MNRRTLALPLIAGMLFATGCSGESSSGSNGTDSGSTETDRTFVHLTSAPATSLPEGAIDCAELPVADVEAIVHRGLVEGLPTRSKEGPAGMPDGAVRFTVCSYDTDMLGAVVRVLIYETTDNATATRFLSELEAQVDDSAGATSAHASLGDDALLLGDTRGLTTAYVRSGVHFAMINVDAPGEVEPLTEDGMAQLVQRVLDLL
jgi:hypothetical protein